MRKPLIAGNWKMHANHLDSIQMIQEAELSPRRW